jgi:hypothetical protein
MDVILDTFLLLLDSTNLGEMKKKKKGKEKYRRHLNADHK